MKQGKFDLVDHVASGKTLLVGEGNLSFARSLARKRRVDPKNLVVTTYEEEADLSPIARGNAARLLVRGVQVVHGVDARDLLASFGDTKFDTIIWNFPLGTASSRGQITPVHQRLMREFFANAAGQLNEGGGVVLTLREGYYGRWRVEQASSVAGFNLAIETPSQLGNFPGYEPVTTYANVEQPDFAAARTYVFRLGGQ